MNQKSGFTLAELSVVLIIIALVVGMTAVSGVTVISAAQYSSTVSKMAALDRALMAFRTANDRLPCPADLSQVQGSATYGTEGSCSALAGGVFVATNAGGTATAAEGGVPTATLGLPNDFMYDGWGNRIRYAVDTRMTSINAFSLMQIGCVNGAITVYGGPNYPATGNTASTTGAIYALISHGANGHGGVTKNAVVTDAGSLNSDEQTNCHCTSTAAAGTYAPTYVQLAPYTYQAIGQANSHYNFDDIVSYKERWQMQTAWDRVGTNCAGGAYSRAITINSSSVSTVNHTNLTNFPMLFSGTYSYLATTANGGDVTNANGYDITFTSDAAGNNLLPFERESWSATTGAVNFWVQVPTVSATANTTIYLWYDDPDITTDQSNKTGTWDSNYKGVWHLSDNAANTTVADSTSNANTGTNAANTSTKTTSGKVGGALSYNGTSDYTTVADNASLETTSNLTLSTWINSTAWTANANIQIYKKNTNYLLKHDSSADGAPCGDTLEFVWWDGTNQMAICTANPSTGTWHYVVGVVSGNIMVGLYVDGSLASSTVTNKGAAARSLTVNELFGGTNSGAYFSGNLDEIRMSNVARSADWINTEYNNQSSPSTFYTVGSAVITR